MKREWYRMPAAVMESDLSKTAAYIIAIMIDRQNPDYKVTIDVKSLQELTGRSRRSVMYALDELRREGWISNVQRTGRASVYTLHNIIGQKKRY